MVKHNQNLSSFIWSIAEILRGHFKQSEYGKIILPFVVLRRLDGVLESSKDAVLEKNGTLPKGIDEAFRDRALFKAVEGDVKVYNLSKFTFDTLHGQDPRQLHDNLMGYITAFSPNVRDILLVFLPREHSPRRCVLSSEPLLFACDRGSEPGFGLAAWPGPSKVATQIHAA